MEVFVLDADYVVEDGEPLVRIFGVDPEGRSVCVLDTFEPYLYAVPKRITKGLIERIENLKDPKVKRVERVKRKLGADEVEALRIVAFAPSDVPNIRDAVKRYKEVGHDGCYEYTVNFYKRYLIDKNVVPGTWYDVNGEGVKRGWKFDFIVRAKSIKPAQNGKPKLRALAMDLESYDEGGKSKIVMVSFYGEKFKKVFTYKTAKYSDYVEVVKDEKELLERIVETVRDQDPDVVVTYNGDEFDFPLLRERCDLHKVKLVLGRDDSELKFARRMRVSSARLNGRVHMDLYQFVNDVMKYHLETEALTLDAVAAEVLGDRKIEVTYEEILASWKDGKDLSKFAQYNLKDSELAFRLAEHFVPQALGLSRVVGQPPFDVTRMSYSQLVEWYLMRKAHELSYITPNQPKYDEIQERRERPKYAGGFVKEPLVGLHDNIAVMDFRSLYPSIIASHNISPETLNCTHKDGQKVPGLKHRVCKKHVGFYSTVVKGLIEERVRVKAQLRKKFDPNLKLEELALKTIANASYGALAYTGAKWYSYECAESSAAFGRFYIKQTMADAEKSGFTVVYADTDSCFVKGPKNVESAAKAFVEKMNKKLPGVMELDLQGVYKRGVFIPRGTGGTAKKRYALIDSKGALTVRGLETVRSDWCKLAREVQTEVLRFVLENKDKESALVYLKTVIERVRAKRVDIKELTLHEQLRKRIEDYRQIGPHVIAAKKIRDRGRPYGVGMVVIYVIVEGSGSISQRAEPLEDVKVENIDAEYYINNQIVPAGMRVLQVFGVSEDELKGFGKQSTIRKFVRG